MNREIYSTSRSRQASVTTRNSPGSCKSRGPSCARLWDNHSPAPARGASLRHRFSRPLPDLRCDASCSPIRCAPDESYGRLAPLPRTPGSRIAGRGRPHLAQAPAGLARATTSLVLYAPNAFVVEHVRERYLARIRELLAHFAGSGDVSWRSARLPRRGSGAIASMPSPSAPRGPGRAAASVPRQPGQPLHLRQLRRRPQQPARSRRGAAGGAEPGTAPTTRCCCTAAPAWARPT